MLPTPRQIFHPLLNPLQHFQHEMNRLFDRWSDDRGTDGGAATFPLVNIWDSGDTLFVEAELPGLNLSDLEIFVAAANQLSLKGERKPVVPTQGVQHRQERGFGKFARTLTLPFPVDANKVEAKLENGVLQLKLAKHESAKPRKIVVKGE